MAPGERAATQTTLGFIPFAVALWADVGLVYADILTDLAAIVEYVMGKHYAFATVATGIFLKSLHQQWREGGLSRLVQAARDSQRLGVKSNAYLTLVKSERTIEAPLALLLQYFTFVYLTNSELAAMTFPVSMALSVRGVVIAIYERTHLGC